MIAPIAAAAAPALSIPGCPGLLDPLCQAVGSAGSTIVGTGANAVLSDLASWVVEGSSWLLGQIGGVLSASTTIALTASWFGTHYGVMATLAMVVVLPMLLLSAIQAVFQQNPSVLVRSALVQLPLAALLTGVAVTLVERSLAVTDALCSAVSAGSGADIQQALSGLATLLVAQAAGGPQSAPTFVVFLGALLVTFGAFMIWLELLVRAAAVYVAVLFLPLGLASLVWPAISHWCRRLVDTLVALVLSKFVIVSVLSLAVAALGSGTQTGFASVLGGAALLLLAAFSPFTLLRLVPAIESGAAQQLEGARHRVRQAFGPVPRNAASFALRQARQSAFVPGPPGTGEIDAFGVPGSDVENQGPGTDSSALGPGGSGVDSSRISGAGSAGAGRSPAGSTAAGAEGASGQVGRPADGVGGLGIPMWQGVAPPTDPLSPAPTSILTEGSDGLLHGKGPLPLWGGAPGLPGEGGDGVSPGGPADRSGSRSGLGFAHDGIGPVVQWTGSSRTSDARGSEVPGPGVGGEGGADGGKGEPSGS